MENAIECPRLRAVDSQAIYPMENLDYWASMPFDFSQAIYPMENCDSDTVYGVGYSQAIYPMENGLATALTIAITLSSHLPDGERRIFLLPVFRFLSSHLPDGERYQVP